jgi:hypothetical protein
MFTRETRRAGGWLFREPWVRILVPIESMHFQLRRERMSATSERRSFVNGLMRGIGSAGEVEQPPIVLSRRRNSLEAMRSDWVRVGRDLDTAISRVNGETSDTDR